MTTDNDLVKVKTPVWQVLLVILAVLGLVITPIILGSSSFVDTGGPKTEEGAPASWLWSGGLIALISASAMALASLKYATAKDYVKWPFLLGILMMGGHYGLSYISDDTSFGTNITIRPSESDFIWFGRAAGQEFTVRADKWARFAWPKGTCVSQHGGESLFERGNGNRGYYEYRSPGDIQVIEVKTLDPGETWEGYTCK